VREKHCPGTFDALVKLDVPLQLEIRVGSECRIGLGETRDEQQTVQDDGRVAARVAATRRRSLESWAKWLQLANA